MNVLCYDGPDHADGKVIGFPKTQEILNLEFKGCVTAFVTVHCFAIDPQAGSVVGGGKTEAANGPLLFDRYFDFFTVPGDSLVIFNLLFPAGRDCYFCTILPRLNAESVKITRFES